MGYGDELLATGMARGAKKRGKRIAFGDGLRIIWGPWSEPMFRYNENIARPGEVLHSIEIEWIAHYKGHRLYNRPGTDRWHWNLDFRPIPGEIVFDARELKLAERHGSGFILIEPNVAWNKTVAPNKYWGRERYQAVADALRLEGHRVVQFDHGRDALAGVEVIHTIDFRQALAIEARAALYIGPEGGLHHGAAAVGIPAVVLFGGFIPPAVTGYPTHSNLTGGSSACGRIVACSHCRAAMDAITVDKVLHAARRHLGATLECSSSAPGSGEQSGAENTQIACSGV